MSIKRPDLIRYLEKNGFLLFREGSKHSLYTNDKQVIPIKGANNSIESQPMNFANRPDEIRNFILPFSKIYLIRIP